MITVENLKVCYGERSILKGLNLQVAEGEVFCLLGANGAGKSTTLNALLGFVEPVSGRAMIDGVDLAEEPRLARSKLVYLPEQVNLYADFNAIENIQYLAALSELSLNSDEIELALRQVGLQADAWSLPLSSYSKGMRQKVGIAFAMLKKAVALLLDEPTSGLDPSATREFIEVVNKLAERGAAILMVTHDLYCAHCVADRIGIMRNGQLLQVLDKASLSLEELEDIYHTTMSPNDVEVT